MTITRINFEKFTDNRGVIAKIFNTKNDSFLGVNIDEVYFSKSKRGIFRGLHYQTGEFGQEKFIYCTNGSLLDVCVCIEQGPNFGQVIVNQLSADDSLILKIPKTYAHGILALEDDTDFINIINGKYVPMAEKGIKWDSLSLNYPISDIVCSDKDANWPSLSEILSQL